MLTRVAYIFFAAALLLVLACEKNTEPQSHFASFRDVPGVTADEIEAIEALQAKKDTLIFGMLFSTEAFYSQSGEIKGNTALFCEYLTNLFGIAFKPAIYEWNDLIAGLKDGSIHFSGELTATEERRKTYQMTDAILMRSVKYFRIKNSAPFEQIAMSRPLRFAFLEGTTTIDDVASASDMNYETIPIPDQTLAHGMLKNGEIDAFFAESNVEALFSADSDIVSKDFFPLIYSPASLTTQKPELIPIISIVQKALQHGLSNYLTKMYNQGKHDFARHRLETSFTEEEREYIRKNPVVAFAAEFDNYPKSFYNKHENEWQGIVFDVLRQVESLTGMSFKIVNTPQTEWSDILNMLEEGKAAMISELIRSKDRENRFLWPEIPFQQDKNALISVKEQPDVDINDVLGMRVGLFKGTAYAELFKNWFPNHTKTIEYGNTISAFEALKRGEVDLIMSGQNYLLMQANYMEDPSYKINVFFDRYYESYLGFNKNEKILCSIINKTLKQIDMKRISEQWTYKIYDYRANIAKARLPWLIGALALLVCVIILLFALYKKTRGEERRLENLVEKRTAELNKQRKMLERISLTDQLTKIPNRRNFDSRIETDWRIAIREGISISILMMDIDRFKTYNDTYGHQKGDVLLQAVAKAITQTINRPGDFAARWGGEEFVVLLPNTDMNGAVKIAQSIRANVEKGAKITISIGVNTLIPTKASSLDGFISAADDALYKAKEMGRNRVCTS
jgi:diguanylate cyclase (GGDEF)-like protein